MYATVDVHHIILLLNEAKEMRELLIGEANCNKKQEEIIGVEMEENHNLRKISI